MRVSGLKQFVYACTPPIILKTIRSSLESLGGRDVFWSGNYSSWEEALSASTGYDSEKILKQVKSSTLKVKSGEAMYERDSLVFDEIQYAWPMLAGLLLVAARYGGKLSVLDFGGSLGSSYFQNRKFLSGLSEVHWNVVEQTNFVDCGQEFIQDDSLRFYSSIEECYLNEMPNVALFSGVLPYLSDWSGVLKTVFNKQIPMIVVDRTAFALESEERITLQTVPEYIYPATYPCRFLNEREFIRTFEEAGYYMVEQFDSLDHANIPSIYKGFIFAYGKI